MKKQYKTPITKFVQLSTNGKLMDFVIDDPFGNLGSGEPAAAKRNDDIISEEEYEENTDYATKDSSFFRMKQFHSVWSD